MAFPPEDAAPAPAGKPEARIRAMAIGRLACISHHPTVEARDTTARTSLRLLAVLNVLSSTPARAKRLAPRPGGPLTHFASPRGEKCRLESATGKPIGSKLSNHRAILLTPRRATAGARRAFHGTSTTGWYPSSTSHSFSRFPNRHRWWCSPLAARGKSPATLKRRCIPVELRCSSVEYVQYAPSSRLVSQAPRRSRCYTGFHHGLLAGARTPSG